jgi:hypothetical protein
MIPSMKVALALVAIVAVALAVTWGLARVGVVVLALYVTWTWVRIPIERGRRLRQVDPTWHRGKEYDHDDDAR